MIWAAAWGLACIPVLRWARRDVYEDTLWRARRRYRKAR